MTDEALDEYWKAYGDDVRRRGQLELYRSLDFPELARYELASLGVPALLLWGEDDEFAPVAGAHRFDRELSDTELVVVDGARHFVWEDAPAECAAALTAFLTRAATIPWVEGKLFEMEEPASGPEAGDVAAQPLAARMRPASLGEFVGQEHLLGRGSALRTAIEDGRPHSMILYGPPGTGKTTLARLLAVNARAAFEEASAVNAGRAEVRAVIERARHRLGTSGERTIFFLDEIHRFNKAQQDTLLPAVEDGTVVLVGATTENPYFEVNSALLSRCRIYELRSLDDEHVLALLRRALGAERGIPDAPRVDDDALEFLAARSAGDARTALSALELAAETVGEGGAVTLRVAEDALQRSAILYDKGGDLHYDLISAWIKSTRGSDPDASLLYLAAMIEGGEDPRFIARRMVVLASEDMATPTLARSRWR